MKKLTLITALIFAMGSLTAQIIHVPADQPTIQAGINAATNGDTILVAEATYYENINFNGKAITVASNFIMDGDTSHISNTIIDGSQPDDPDIGSVVTFDSGEDTTSVLNGFTITGGTGTLIQVGEFDLKAGGGINFMWSGGKVLNNYIEYNIVDYQNASMGGGITAGGPIDPLPHVELRGNKIRYNKAISQIESAEGGGIDIFYNLIMIDNEVYENEAIAPISTLAGGVAIKGINGHIDILVENNLITQNKSVSNSISLGYSEAGGLFLAMDCSGIVSNNMISFNLVEAPGSKDRLGGGVMTYYLNPDLLFENNFIRNNYFEGEDCFGGGLCIWYSGGTYQNNVIQNNLGSYGGGIGVYDNSINSTVLVNNTITENEADYGGGLYLQDANAVVFNTILYDNIASVEGDQIFDLDDELEVWNSNVQGGWPGTDNMDVDPLFRDGYHLDSLSTLVDAGTFSIIINDETYYAPEYDIDGDERPFAGTEPDIGADEALWSVVGIIEQSKTDLAVSVYPNPYSGQTNIYNSSDKSLAVDVYDISGKLLEHFIVPAGERFEYRDNYEVGVRILKWITEDNVGVLRIVKLQ